MNREALPENPLKDVRESGGIYITELESTHRQRYGRYLQLRAVEERYERLCMSRTVYRQERAEFLVVGAMLSSSRFVAAGLVVFEA